MNLANLKRALIGTYDDVVDNHTLQMAAALAYYFVLSLFPALIFLSSIVAYLPAPGPLQPGIKRYGPLSACQYNGLGAKKFWPTSFLRTGELSSHSASWAYCGRHRVVSPLP